MIVESGVHWLVATINIGKNQAMKNNFDPVDMKISSGKAKKRRCQPSGMVGSAG